MENWRPCEVCGDEVALEPESFDPMEGFTVRLCDSEKVEDEDGAVLDEEKPAEGDEWKDGDKGPRPPGRIWVFCSRCGARMSGAIDRLVAKRGENYRKTRTLED